MTGRMHFSAKANWMMFTKEERRNIAIYILGISMSHIYFCRGIVFASFC